MKLAVASLPVPPHRFFVRVSMAVFLLLAIPAPAFATCWECGFSDMYPWPSWMCKEITKNLEWGLADCDENRTGGGTMECETSGLLCLNIVITVSHDQEAVSRILAGVPLPADGAHFFVVDGDDAVVMRKCDMSVVARIPHHQIPQMNAELAIATTAASEARPRSGLAAIAAVIAWLWVPMF